MKKKIINILFNDFTDDYRVEKESVSLLDGGYEVELAATRFKKDLQVEEDKKGITVVRYDVGKVKFLLTNLFLFWIAIVRRYKEENLFHCNDLYALPPAWIIKKFYNKDARIIYDCHEHETEASIYIGKPVLKFLAKISERFLIKDVDKVITVNESIAQEYQDMYGIEKPYLVLNCPPYREYPREDLFREEFNIPKDKIIFIYQGEYKKGRGVEKLIKIFNDLEEKNKNIVLVLLVFGEGVEPLKESVKDSKNIYWHDKVPREIYMRYVVSCDWAIFLMENICKNHDYALPNKLFDYVMANIPIVVSNLKEMSNFVNSNKVGFTIDENDYEATLSILNGIKHSTKDRYIDNLKKVAKKYSWEEQEKVLLKIYNSL